MPNKRRHRGRSYPDHEAKRFRNINHSSNLSYGFPCDNMGYPPIVSSVPFNERAYDLRLNMPHHSHQMNYNDSSFSRHAHSLEYSPNDRTNYPGVGHELVVAVNYKNRHVFFNNHGNGSVADPHVSLASRSGRFNFEEEIIGLSEDDDYKSYGADQNVHECETVAELKPEVVEITKQNGFCCFNSPYLISKNPCERLVHFLQNDPPDFFKQLKTFTNLNKSKCLVEFVCRDCVSGPMSTLDHLIAHLTGKSHVRKAKLVETGSAALSKITICQVCFRINCYTSNFNIVENETKDLPRNLQNIFRRMFPDAISKPIVSKSDQEQKVTKNKNVTTVHMILSGINKNFTFAVIFDEIVKFSKENGNDLQYICVVNKPQQKFSYCRLFRSRQKPEFGLHSSLYINGSRVKVEIVASFSIFLERIREEYNQKSLCWKWSIGNLTPPCEIFYDWNHLMEFIGSKLEEMEETCREYSRLTSLICRDLRRATTNYVDVTSVDFFGSRVTGLALYNSDFDLQLTTGTNCSVRALSKHLKPFFRIIEVIPWAKVPIIRIQHDVTNTRCDISLNNMNGVINSKLLRFYLDMDDRVKWLVVTVKLWASMNLINGSFAFTSYGLAWFVLFFLMQKEIALVPMVQTLSKLPCYNGCMLFSQETNMKLSLDMNELMRVYNPKIKCRMDMHQLLLAFFRFSLQATSSKNALDTFTAQSLSRKEVANSCRSRLTEGNLNRIESIFSYSFIIIDPIKHSANICASVNSKVLNNFRVLAQQTLDILSEP